MKKITLIFLAFIFIFVNINAQNQQIVVGNHYTNPNEVTLVAERGVSTTIKFDVSELNLMDVRTNYGNATAIFSGKAPLILEAGVPEIFYLPSAIIIPDVGAAELEITYGEYTDIENIDLVPSKGNLSRSIDPNTIPYVKGEVYNQDAFFPGELAKINETFIMRDVRGLTIFAYPVQYNPVTKVLRIYSEMTITVNYTDNPGENEFTTQKRHKTIDPEFSAMYNRLFLNSSVIQQRGYPTGEEGEMLIICHPAFMEDMQPFVNWKRTMGRKTTMEPTTATGTTAAQIKSYIASYYNNPDNNLAYVLLVGDHAQIPVHFSSEATDIFYGQITSTPYLDVFIGRFSAENVTHVQTQANRSIHYERNLTTEDTWGSVGIGVARNEGNGSGHDGGEADHVHMNNIRDRMLTYGGYNPVYQEYDGGAGVPNTTAAQINQRVNAGASVLNYCNHGSQTGWSVANYTNSNVNQLQNTGKWPFLYLVACNNGEFNTGLCFSEVWMRHTYNSQPAGAIAVFGAIRSIGWQPPMTAQDEFVNIYLGRPSTYGTVQPGTKRTMAGAMLNSSQKMILHHGASGSNLLDYNSWTVFGDPSLMFRTKTPEAMTVSHLPVIFIGQTSLTVSCNAEGATAALSYIDDNDEVIIVGVATVTGGMAEINFNVPINVPMDLTLCVTGFNKVTHIGEVSVIPPDGPYVVYSSYEVIGADVLTYISTNAEIEVTVKNVGIETSAPLFVTISTDDPQLNITLPTAQCPAIAPGETASVRFKVTVANDIPNNKTFPVDVRVTEESKAQFWDSRMALKAYAPDFKLEKVLVNGVENGNMPKGSLVTLTAIVKNDGGADAYFAEGELVINSQYVNFACEEQIDNEQNIPAGESVEYKFYVVTNSDMPSGHTANFNFNLEARYERTFSAPFTAINLSGSYCVPGTTGCNSGDRFTNVVLWKTSEPGNLLIDNQNGNCVNNGYSDFTSTIVELEPGQQYSIKIKCVNYQQQVRGWFDLNGNGIFDANELLVSMNLPANQELTQTFTIPENLCVPGTYRFRLRCQYNTTAPGTCDGYTYGQTHDYTIVIPELYPRVQDVNAELTDNNIVITWQAPEEVTPVGYNIYRDNNKLNTTLLNNPTFTEGDIVSGVYVYNVTAVYAGDKESLTEMSNVICNILPPQFCEEPDNLAVVLDEEGIPVITWDEPVNIDGILKGYIVYRDETILTDPMLFPEVREFRDIELGEGTYIYKVEAVYKHCEAPTDGFPFTIIGIREVTIDAFKLFPNPATNTVTIKGEGISYVEIYDIQGRKLLEQKAEGRTQKGDGVVINVSSFQAGVYLVKIYSENNQAFVKRLVITK